MIQREQAAKLSKFVFEVARAEAAETETVIIEIDACIEARDFIQRELQRRSKTGRKRNRQPSRATIYRDKEKERKANEICRAAFAQ